jgi:hypothetical protein
VVWDIDDDEYAPAIARKAIYEVSRKKTRQKNNQLAEAEEENLKREIEKTIGSKRHDTWESH